MRRFRFGLLARVLLLQVATLGLAAILVPVAVDMLLGARTEFYEHKVLSARARSVAEALHMGADGRIALAPGLFDREGDRGEFGFSVVGEDGSVLLSSTAFAAGVLAPTSRGSEVLFGELQSGGRHYAVTSLPVSLAGHTVWVLLGWDLDTEEIVFDDIRRGFLPVAIGAAAPVLLLLLVISTLVVRRFFRPVLQVTRDVELLDPSKTGVRLTLLALPAEILPLAQAFNGALDRVEHAARIQGEFTADAAHELRTPLAILDARVQGLPNSVARDELLGDVRRLSRIVSQLLDLARLEHVSMTGTDADLLAVCTAVIGDLAPEAISRGQRLGLQAPENCRSLRVRVSEQDAWHMLRNLVENAIRHTPHGTVIEVFVACDGTLTVRDDGPGIPQEMHERIFQRFWRSRRSDGSGAGLGLAIARRVAEASGGSLTLAPGNREGTAFVVRLPIQTSQAPARDS